MRSHKYARYVCAVLCLAGILSATLYFTTPASSQQKPNFDQQVSRSFSRYDVLELDASSVARQVRQTSVLTLETSEGAFELTLVPNDMRADNYRAEAVLDGGAVRAIPRDAARTYKGTVGGIDGGQARLTIDEGVVEGMIITPTGKYFIEPASRYSTVAGTKDFLFYRDSDVIQGAALECGVTMAGKVESEVARVQATTPGLIQPYYLSPNREIDLATDADFEYYQASGNNETAANGEILTIMNEVEGIYQREIGLTFNIIYQRVWTTSADPYDAQTLADLLNQVRVEWRDRPPAGTQNRDMVHMWTGRNLDGLTTGLAYSSGNGVNGVVCRFQEIAVGVSERVVTLPQKYVVTAHEMGHNLGAVHPEDAGHSECGLTIMSGLVLPTTQATFCQFSRDQIEAYVNANNGCLAAVTTQSTVQFGQTDYRLNEDGKSVQITVTRSSGTGASTVEYQTVNGTANDRSDYTTALGVLRFAQGETSKTFNVFITDDAYAVNTKAAADPTSEAAVETFQVLLTNPTGATVGTPSQATVSIVNNDAVNGANPVKDATFNTDFFVRQQYIDFFNREPDAGGFAFWKNQINECTTQECREVRRINTSAAFFLSIEFQETGFYVIRIHRAAFGGRSNSPALRISYRPFIRDARQVGEGVVVGEAGYEQRLEQNKQAYAEQIVTSAAFIAAFPTAQGAAQYVDALYATAGVSPTATERQTAINAFGGGGTAGRVAALRSVVDSTSLREAELRSAFVLLEYFGYMRRNPTDPPDTSDAGYQFWLGKLNQFNGNYIAAEMVKAFITSGEYYDRFGQ